MVKAPTRDQYLLDLVLTDIEELSHSEVLSPFADHNLVRSFLDFSIPEVVSQVRAVFDYSSANWHSIRRDLSNCDWTWLENFDVDTATRYLTCTILEVLERHVRKKVVEERSGRHPWLNDRCLRLVKAKHDAYGTDEFQDKAKACSAGLKEEYDKFTKSICKRLSKLPRGSKHWWKLARTMMDKRSKSSSIPALRDSLGNWILENEIKTNLFTDTFVSKFGLPDLVINEYSFSYRPSRVINLFQ